MHDLGALRVEGAAACLTRAGHQRAGVDRALGTGPSSATNSCVALDTDHRLHSHMDTGLLGSGNLETRGEGVLGNWSGKVVPRQSAVRSQSKMEGPSGERGASQRDGGVGEGAQRGLGLCPAQTRWLSLAGQKFHQASLSRCWILCLWHSWGAQVPSFQEAQGMPFLQRLTRNQACPFCPRGAGGWCP